MLLVYKSLNGYMNITSSSFGLELSHTSTRGGGLVENFCFRATQERDSLPDSCIKCVSIAGFKSAFRKYF